MPTAKRVSPLHIRPAEYQQRQWFVAVRFPMAFQRGDLRGLMFERVQAVHVTHHGLDGGDDQQHSHRHRQHLADGRIVVTAQ
jgi:hypothetical protein